MTMRFWQECKVAAQFSDEPLQFSDDGRLQILFRVAILQVQKIQEVRIAKHQIGCNLPTFPELLDLMPDRFLRLFTDRAHKAWT